MDQGSRLMDCIHYGRQRLRLSRLTADSSNNKTIIEELPIPIQLHQISELNQIGPKKPHLQFPIILPIPKRIHPPDLPKNYRARLRFRPGGSEKLPSLNCWAKRASSDQKRRMSGMPNRTSPRSTDTLQTAHAPQGEHAGRSARGESAAGRRRRRDEGVRRHRGTANRMEEKLGGRQEWGGKRLRL